MTYQEITDALVEKKTAELRARLAEADQVIEARDAQIKALDNTTDYLSNAFLKQQKQLAAKDEEIKRLRELVNGEVDE